MKKNLIKNLFQSKKRRKNNNNSPTVSNSDNQVSISMETASTTSNNGTTTIAEEYLALNYPSLKERLNVVNLDINDKQLKGELDLRDFINLETLNCSNNQLTE